MTIPIIPNYAPGIPYGPHADLTGNMQTLALQVSNPGIGPGHALFIGDSLTLDLYYRAACHDWIINLGIGGMRAHDFLPYIPTIMQTVQPNDVIIALGKNDYADPSLTFWNWQQDYWWLAAAVQNKAGTTYHDPNYTGVNPVLMTIIPTESNVSPDLARFKNKTAWLQWNDYIANPDPADGVGANLSCPVQDACAALSGPDGYLPAGSTLDGVHPKGTLNAALWGQFVLALQTSRAARGAPTDNIMPVMIP